MQLLLVEDDLNLAMAIEYALRSEGYEVILAGSVKDALNRFHEGIGMVLLDVMLPDGSGYQILNEIRKNSQVPVIFLTACDEEANVVLGLDAGADDYVTKPIRVKELLSRIKAVLRRRGPEETHEGAVLKSGALSVHVLESKVKKGVQEIALTALEYKLLLFLMRNPKSIITRNRLLEVLWDCNGDFVDDNALSVYIRRLREKIEEDADQPMFIKTIRGMGYKWDCEVRKEQG